jgi:hypothetical protein
MSSAVASIEPPASRNSLVRFGKQRSRVWPLRVPLGCKRFDKTPQPFMQEALRWLLIQFGLMLRRKEDFVRYRLTGYFNSGCR